MTSREAEELVQQLFDGTISEADSCRLEEQLALRPDLTEVYRKHALLHTFLQSSHNQHQSSPLPHIGAPSETPPPSKVVPLVRPLTLVVSLAAALALAALFVFRSPGPTPSPAGSQTPPALSFRTAQDSKFLIVSPSELRSEHAKAPANTVPVGAIFHLNQGTAELKFRSGVTGILTAPSKFTLQKPEVVQMAHGRARFKVPKGAEGFQVYTPGLKLTDWGTEFDVVTYSGSTDEVHVREGKVEIESLFGRKENRMLVQGESVRNTKYGSLKNIATGKPNLPDSLPEGLHYLHFPFEETSQNDLGVRGNHPSLSSLQIKLKQSDGRPAADRFIEGPFGKALSFDGAGDTVITNWPGIYGQSPLTISLWAFYHEGNEHWGSLVGWGLGKHDNPGEEQNQLKLLLYPGKNPRKRFFKCSFGKDSGAHVSLGHAPVSWHHYAVVYTGNTEPSAESSLRFYLDGELANPKYYLSPRPPERPGDLSTAKPLVMGEALSAIIPPETRFFKGALDELYIIEGALSEAQIKRLAKSNKFR